MAYNTPSTAGKPMSFWRRVKKFFHGKATSALPVDPNLVKTNDDKKALPKAFEGESKSINDEKPPPYSSKSQLEATKCPLITSQWFLVPAKELATQALPPNAEKWAFVGTDYLKSEGLKTRTCSFVVVKPAKQETCPPGQALFAVYAVGRCNHFPPGTLLATAAGLGVYILQPYTPEKK